MKKLIMASIIILMSSMATVKADEFCDNFNCSVFKQSSVKKMKSAKNTKQTKQKKTRTALITDDIPVVGDIVRSLQSGIASFYWQPQPVACGGRFNPNAMTAAHKTLPCGSKVRVTNNRNGKSVVVTINDRGPYVKGRIIDLSKAAAQVIGMTGAGLAPVTVSRLN